MRGRLRYRGMKGRMGRKRQKTKDKRQKTKDKSHKIKVQKINGLAEEGFCPVPCALSPEPK
jgi:hypothetical protein